MDIAKIAYVAGFFDGEGSMGIRKAYFHEKAGRWQTHSPYLTISQNTKGPLHLCQEVLGGTISFNSGGGPNGIWVLQASGAKRVLPALRLMLPYLIVKKRQAEVLLEAYPVVSFNRRNGTPPWLFELRERNRVEISEMKRAGAASCAAYKAEVA